MSRQLGFLIIVVPMLWFPSPASGFPRVRPGLSRAAANRAPCWHNRIGLFSCCWAS